MSTKGWNSLKPITTPDQMSAPIHWNPMNEDWTTPGIAAAPALPSTSSTRKKSA